jgi:hypothetical protein
VVLLEHPTCSSAAALVQQLNLTGLIEDRPKLAEHARSIATKARTYSGPAWYLAVGVYSCPVDADEVA